MDGCVDAFAGVLVQETKTTLPGGKEVTCLHPIAFASKRTSASEENYKPFLLEFATLKFAFNKFSDIMYGYRTLTHMFGSHDKIAKIMGMPSQSFEDTYEDQATDMKQMVLDYIKTLCALHLASASTGPRGVGTSHSTTILWDQDGFPLVPSSMSWDKVGKEDLEAMY